MTTYPAIVVARNQPSVESEKIAFAHVYPTMPEDLSAYYDANAARMDRRWLTHTTWRFETNERAALRAKIFGDLPTLGEVYGPPRYGIKTGDNDAFIIDSNRREEIVSRDPNSASVIKPYLRGTSAWKWFHESSEDWILFTNSVENLDRFPGIVEHLAPFKEALEPKPIDYVETNGKPWKGRKAGSYHWYQLQDNVAFWQLFERPKIVFQDLSNDGSFSRDDSGVYPANTCYFIDCGDFELLALLNSRLVWFLLRGLTNIARGGYLRLRTEFVQQLPIPEMDVETRSQLANKGGSATKAARERYEIQAAVRRRLLDLAPPERAKLNNRLHDWHDLDFSALRAEIKRAFRVEIPVKERGEWEAYLAENGSRVKALTAAIAAAEREIDAIVYKLFDLTPEEIALLEASLEGQY